MKLSQKKYLVRAKDLLKGLYMAVSTAVYTLIQKTIDTALLGTPPAYPVWKLVCMAAIGAALGYIGRKVVIARQNRKKTIEDADQN